MKTIRNWERFHRILPEFYSFFFCWLRSQSCKTNNLVSVWIIKRSRIIFRNYWNVKKKKTLHERRHEQRKWINNNNKKIRTKIKQKQTKKSTKKKTVQDEKRQSAFLLKRRSWLQFLERNIIQLSLETEYFRQPLGFWRITLHMEIHSNIYKIFLQIIMNTTN